MCRKALRSRSRIREPISAVLHQLAGGLRASMGMWAQRRWKNSARKATFVRISNAGLRESHSHGVAITTVKARTIRAVCNTVQRLKTDRAAPMEPPSII
ncbi:IMP dehydrogenase [Brucella abortus]|nr:IMP dehydrogenase [Brucella abortus]